MVILVGFKKAYDSTDRHTLFNSLEEFRIYRKTIEIMKQTLTTVLRKSRSSEKLWTLWNKNRSQTRWRPITDSRQHRSGENEENLRESFGSGRNKEITSQMEWGLALLNHKREDVEKKVKYYAQNRLKQALSYEMTPRRVHMEMKRGTIKIIKKLKYMRDGHNLNDRIKAQKLENTILHKKIKAF